MLLGRIKFIQAMASITFSIMPDSARDTVCQDVLRRYADDGAFCAVYRQNLPLIIASGDDNNVII